MYKGVTEIMPKAAMKSGVKIEDMTCEEVQLATIKKACVVVSPIKLTTSIGQVMTNFKIADPFEASPWEGDFDVI